MVPPRHSPRNDNSSWILPSLSTCRAAVSQVEPICTQRLAQVVARHTTRQQWLPYRGAALGCMVEKCSWSLCGSSSRTNGRPACTVLYCTVDVVAVVFSSYNIGTSLPPQHSCSPYSSSARASPRHTANVGTLVFADFALLAAGCVLATAARSTAKPSPSCPTAGWPRSLERVRLRCCLACDFSKRCPCASR